MLTFGSIKNEEHIFLKSFSGKFHHFSFKVHIFCEGHKKYTYNVKTKGGFFSESAICFLDLQISKKKIPKNYLELEI